MFTLLLSTLVFASDPNMQETPLPTKHQNFIDIQKLNFAIQKKYGSVPLRRPQAAKEMYKIYILQFEWGALCFQEK